MELAIQIMFLVLGFCVALFVGGMLTLNRTKGVPKGLSVDDGAVRLDDVGRGKRLQRSAPDAHPETGQSESEESETEAAIKRPATPGKRKRKR
ncbi:MAG TPA: hypothetical protein VHS06_01535 [Chloroflexota bacterium]|nr:hypothetical protein [Chloroflexota bacterium]